MALRVSLKFSMLGTRCKISSVTLQPEHKYQHKSRIHEPDIKRTVSLGHSNTIHRKKHFTVQTPYTADIQVLQ